MRSWDDLRVLLLLHREGTLARAATALDVDATTVSRRLAALEEQLGVRLVVKNRGSVTFTRAGLDVVAEAERAERILEQAGRVARANHDEIAGPVRIATTEQLAAGLVAPHLPELLAKYPELQIDVRVAAEIAALGRDVDVALRIAPPHGEALKVRRAGELGFAFYRSRDAKPSPKPDLLMYSAVIEARNEREMRRDLAATARVRLTSTSANVLREAALQGLGVALLPCFRADPDPLLVRVPLGPDVRRPLWVVVHRDEAAIARVRAVADWLLAVCRARAADLRGRPA